MGRTPSKEGIVYIKENIYMDFILSTGLLNHNSCQLNTDLLVYTDIKVYEDFTQSLYLTFISKDSITGFIIEGGEFVSSISEETNDGELMTRLEIKLLEDDTKFTYKEYVWVTTYYEDELYVCMPNNKSISYSEDDGFLDDPSYLKQI